MIDEDDDDYGNDDHDVGDDNEDGEEKDGDVVTMLFPVIVDISTCSDRWWWHPPPRAERCSWTSHSSSALFSNMLIKDTLNGNKIKIGNDDNGAMMKIGHCSSAVGFWSNRPIPPY